MTTNEKDLTTEQASVIEASSLDAGHHHSTSLYRQILDESNAMASYALSNGFDVDPVTINSLNKLATVQEPAPSADDVTKQLAAVHQTLRKSVYPATPRTIVLLAREKRKHPFMYFLGPVPLIRRLSATAAGFLILLLAVSMDPDVNIDNINRGLLNSSNHELFLNQLFLLCAAGLGASFSALFQASGFIAKATYDPRYDSSYWSRIILGVISGIIIVELLPHSLFEEGSMKSFGKPSLAMLGGFSANVVYRILQRLVESMETLVKGTGASDQERQQALLQVKSSEQRTQLSADTAARLVELLREVDGMDKADVSKKINGFIRDLLPGSGRET